MDTQEKQNILSKVAKAEQVASVSKDYLASVRYELNKDELDKQGLEDCMQWLRGVAMNREEHLNAEGYICELVGVLAHLIDSEFVKQ